MPRRQPVFAELPVGLAELCGVGSMQELVESPPLDRPEPWAGVVHEILPEHRSQERRDDRLPVGLLVHWVRQQLTAETGTAGRLAVWVGRRTWPYPRVLWRCGLLGRSVFVNARDDQQRLWTAELALRSPAVGVVVADGSNFSMTATRRLQLAARESRGVMLLPRPARDARRLSASGVRWRVGPVSSADIRPRWKVELLRCKGVRPMPLGTDGQYPLWTLHWEGEQATADVVGPTASPGTGFPLNLPRPFAPAIPGGLPAKLGDRPGAAAQPVAAG